MISWLFIIILSYLFFGLFSLGDKLLLSGPVSPKVYTFYVGLLNGLAVVLIVFSPLTLPTPQQFIWIILNAVVFILGLYVMFLALEKFEVSRVMPTIGALQPIFIFFAAWAFFGLQPINAKDFLAFVALLAGTVVIAKEEHVIMRGSYAALTLVASLFFSLDYVIAKIVFSELSFLQGLIWVRIWVCLFVLVFLFSKSFRAEISAQRQKTTKNNALLFFATQSSGALATFLQSFAIFLAPVGYLAIMNALRGIQYVFLFGVTLTFSVVFPRILKEEVSKKIITQKSLAITLIIVGLAILVLH